MQIFWKNWDFSIFFSDTWSWCGGYLWRLDILGVLSCRLQMTHWDRSTGGWKHSRGKICKWPNLEKVKNCELLKERKMASISWRNHCSCRLPEERNSKYGERETRRLPWDSMGFFSPSLIISSSINNQKQNQQYLKSYYIIIHQQPAKKLAVSLLFNEKRSSDHISTRSSPISSIVIIF